MPKRGNWRRSFLYFVSFASPKKKNFPWCNKHFGSGIKFIIILLCYVIFGGASTNRISKEFSGDTNEKLLHFCPLKNEKKTRQIYAKRKKLKTCKFARKFKIFLVHWVETSFKSCAAVRLDHSFAALTLFCSAFIISFVSFPQKWKILHLLWWAIFGYK